jgi:hypothetical protein
MLGHKAFMMLKKKNTGTSEHVAQEKKEIYPRET